MSASINDSTTTIIQCYKSLFGLYPKMSSLHYVFSVFKSLETLQSKYHVNPENKFFNCNSLYLQRVLNDFPQLRIIEQLIPDNAIREYYHQINEAFNILIKQKLDQPGNSQICIESQKPQSPMVAKAC